jgi:diguanylate cyclase (GGDEF)-like protein
MQRIAILYDASQAVLSTFQLDEVFDRILTIVRDYFHLEGGAIFLLDKESKQLTSRLSFGKEPCTARIPWGEGLTGSAARLKRPIYAPDVSKDPRYISGLSATKSELAIPLMVRDEVVGVLDCQSNQLDFFDSETIDLLTLFATQASIGLVNAEIYSKEQKRAQQMEAISAIARQATGVLKLEELLVELCGSIVHSLPQYSVALLTTEKDGTLILRAHSGSLSPTIETSQTLLPRGNSAQESLEKRVTRVVRASGDDIPILLPQAGSVLLLPLVSAAAPLGVLAVGAEAISAFVEDEVVTLSSVADICASAIQNALYFQQAEELAYVDGLTGVGNRRIFEKRIREELDRASRYQTTMSVIMIDIDHFKRVNDEFGHLLGDEVLRIVSQMFQQALRKPDVCCRFGGEEFAIILPETSGQNACLVAEKLRKMACGHDFPGIPRPITISAGVADFPRCGSSRDELVRAADESLYLAKQTGRNCVQFAQQENIAHGAS